MSNMKYIRFEEMGIVIFESHIPHDVMARRFQEQPISAGFVFLPNNDECGNKATCYGESVSLNLKSTEADTKRLQRLINPYA